MRILGIDPALNSTGYGLIDSEGKGLSAGKQIKLLEAGFIKTSPKDSLDQRLSRIYNALLKFIGDNSPEVLVLEKIYSHIQHPATAFILGHARGVICLAASMSNITVVELAATKVKKAVSGCGNASKLQVKRMMQHFFNIKDSDLPFDVFDALALAVTYANMRKTRNEENLI